LDGLISMVTHHYPTLNSLEFGELLKDKVKKVHHVIWSIWLDDQLTAIISHLMLSSPNIYLAILLKNCVEALGDI